MGYYSHTGTLNSWKFEHCKLLKHQNDLENQEIRLALQWKFLLISVASNVINMQKKVVENVRMFHTGAFSKLFPISFPNVRIHLVSLIPDKSLGFSCSHILFVCLFLHLVAEKPWEHSRVQICVKLLEVFKFSFLDSKGQRNTCILLQIFLAYQWNKFNFCFVWFCITNRSYFIIMSLSKMNWMVIKYQFHHLPCHEDFSLWKNLK